MEGADFVRETSAEAHTTVVATDSLVLLDILGSAWNAAAVTLFTTGDAAQAAVEVGAVKAIVKVRRPPGIRVSVDPPHSTAVAVVLRRHPGLCAGRKLALVRADGIKSVRRTSVAMPGPVLLTVTV